jgi:hypothetical protein
MLLRFAKYAVDATVVAPQESLLFIAMGRSRVVHFIADLPALAKSCRSSEVRPIQQTPFFMATVAGIAPYEKH